MLLFQQRYFTHLYKVFIDIFGCFLYFIVFLWKCFVWNQAQNHGSYSPSLKGKILPKSFFFFSPQIPVFQVGAIIITPTRELAIQIDEVLSHFTKHFPMFRWVNFSTSMTTIPSASGETEKLPDDPNLSVLLFQSDSSHWWEEPHGRCWEVQGAWVSCVFVCQCLRAVVFSLSGFSAQSCAPAAAGGGCAARIFWEIVGSVPGVRCSPYVTSAPFICWLGEEQSWKCLQWIFHFSLLIKFLELFGADADDGVLKESCLLLAFAWRHQIFLQWWLLSKLAVNFLNFYCHRDVLSPGHSPHAMASETWCS